MAEADGQASVTAAAAANMRETAKWLFTGVVATAGAVVAGSSLTSLGSLDFGCRFVLAIIGVVVGFGGVAWLFHAIVAMLRRDIVTARMLVANDDYKFERNEIDRQFKGFDFGGAQNMTDLLQVLDAEFKKPMLERDVEFLKQGNAVLDKMTEVGVFYVVRNQFNRMLSWMWAQVLLIIIGFGLFAWAANPPPDPPEAEHGITIKIVP